MDRGLNKEVLTMTMKNQTLWTAAALVVLLAATVSCDSGSAPQAPTDTPDQSSAEMENLVRREPGPRNRWQTARCGGDEDRGEAE